MIAFIIFGVFIVGIGIYALLVSKKRVEKIVEQDNFVTSSKDKYLVSFKISYPLSNGTYRETKVIDV